MTSFSTFQGYRDSQRSFEQTQNCGVDASNSTIGRARDCFRNLSLSAGSIPSTAVAPDSTTAGAIEIVNAGSGKLVVTGANLSTNASSTSLILCDRLSHQGGLSANVTTAQTTNLPTAALTRYTDGAGVLIGISVYTANSSTVSTISVSYTNQAGVSGRTTPAQDLAPTAQRLMWLPFQSGDSGVRSVESVTVSTATGTAGNLGVTLFKPICGFELRGIGYNNQCDLFSNSMFGGIEEIKDNACLFWVSFAPSTLYSHFGFVNFAEI